MLVHTKHNPHTEQREITIAFGLPDGYMPSNFPMLCNAIHQAFLRLVNISDLTPRENISAPMNGLRNFIALVVNNNYKAADVALALQFLVEKNKIKAGVDVSARRQEFFLSFFTDELAQTAPSYLRTFNATAPAQ